MIEVIQWLPSPKKLALTVAILTVLLLNCCNSTRVTVHPGWGKYFKEAGVRGCFMLHDYTLHQFAVYNQPRMEQRFLPAATFNTLNTLIGLETGIIRDTNMVIRWNGIVKSNPDWPMDPTLAQAFRNSITPYFQEVARRIGRDTLQQYLDSIKFGNMVIGSQTDSFWLDNSLKISPDELLGFLEKLYFSKLPFTDLTQRMVRGVMQMENSPLYELYYNTGNGIVGSKKIEWVDGWEEENGHPFFFVLNTESSNTGINLKKTSLEILMAILMKAGLMRGRM
ncbi:MAG TPA: penicillin-binding transpeptidase domain-containing protein [Chitinophagaceae bacterium]|nr:penicillin-binding transpeptidase domain-containing protein [Chitinophagaceae bacterium]